MSNKHLTQSNQSNLPAKFSLYGDFDKLFQDFSRDFINYDTLLPKLFRGASSDLKISPRIDISEDEKSYIVEADLPGVKEDDIDISVSKDGVLSIIGKRENVEEQKKRNYHRIERSYGSFERSMLLPENHDPENIQADFNDGILTITIAKKEPSSQEVKKIKITGKR